MSLINRAQSFTLFFCEGVVENSITLKPSLKLICQAFGNHQVYACNSGNSCTVSPEEKISKAANSLFCQIISLSGRESHHFILFAIEDGIKIAQIALKKINEKSLNIPIHVFCFGGTDTLISNDLATKVEHYVFLNHLEKEHTILNQMASVNSRMQSQNSNLTVAIFLEASEIQRQTNTSRYGKNFFDVDFRKITKKIEHYFNAYSVIFLDEELKESPENGENCQLLAYSRRIQEIAKEELTEEVKKEFTEY